VSEARWISRSLEALSISARQTRLISPNRSSTYGMSANPLRAEPAACTKSKAQ
jgi:hypothetical protein